MPTNPSPAPQRAWPTVLLGTALILIAFALWLLGAPAQPAETPVVASRPLFDTTVTIKAFGPDRGRVRRAVELAFAEAGRLDRLLNYYSRDSEISRVNRLAATRPVTVSEDVARLLQLAEAGRRWSHGAFDVRIGRLMDAWGFGRQEHIPTRGELADARAASVGKIIIDPRGPAVSLGRPRAKIDLGSIGKGYAMERAAAVLRKEGATAALVTCGSSTRVFGLKPGGRKWRIAVESPRPGQPKDLGILELTDANVSTSGDYQQYFIRHGTRYHHILDARTGYPSRGLISVTVIMHRRPSAPDNGAMADMMSTALMAPGPLTAHKILAQEPRLQAILVSDDGRVYVSPGLRSGLRRAVHRIAITGP